MDTKTRANLRREWINCLHMFATPALQQCWVTPGDGQLVASFTECMCAYFDDLNLTDGLEAARQDGWISSDEVTAVPKFHRLADAYEDPSGSDDAAVLQDPRWSDVVRAAQDAWMALRDVIADASERDMMDNLETRWGRISQGPS